MKTLREECQNKESTVLTNWKASISKVSDRASVRLLAQRVKEITYHFDYGGPIIQNLSPEEEGGFLCNNETRSTLGQEVEEFDDVSFQSGG